MKKLAPVLAGTLLLPVALATMLRCGDERIEVRNDYFGLWTALPPFVFSSEELAMRRKDGSCAWYGHELVIVWGRSQMLDLASTRRNPDARRIRPGERDVFVNTLRTADKVDGLRAMLHESQLSLDTAEHELDRLGETLAGIP